MANSAAPAKLTSAADPATARTTLDAFDKAIKAKRLALDHRRASRVFTNADWEEMLRGHRERQLQIFARGSLSSQFVEGFRLDLDILRHAFRRWVCRVDRTF
jgi:hypothetical protein